MKHSLCVLAVVFGAFAQSQPPSPGGSKLSQPKQTTATTENHKGTDDKTSSQPITITVVNSPEVNGAAKQHQSESSTDWWMRAFTGLIFLATAVQAYIYWHQKELMREALGETTKAADAAKASADAANRNIDLMISEKRARLKIGIQEVSTEVSLSKQLIWTITNHGNSKAFITYAQSRAYCVRGDEAPTNISASSLQNPALYRNPLKPDEQFNDFAVVLPHFGAEVETDIRDERVLLYFYAFVKYRDAFGSYQTKVLRRLHPIPVWASQRPGYAEWQPEGDPNDNQET
jgi:hypothetical protein